MGLIAPDGSFGNPEPVFFPSWPLSGVLLFSQLGIPNWFRLCNTLLAGLTPPGTAWLLCAGCTGNKTIPSDPNGMQVWEESEAGSL